MLKLKQFRIVLIVQLIVFLFFVSACAQQLQQAKITDIIFQENFLRGNDNLNILIKIDNGFDVSFTPKIKLDYNTKCFSSYNNVLTSNPIKAKDNAKISATISPVSYTRECKGTETITVTLYDAATDSPLHSLSKNIDVVTS